MTEQFQEWVEHELAGVPGALPDHEQRLLDEIASADFWLRAFVGEVRSRWEPSGVLMGDSANLGLAFDEVVQEFGLEQP